MHNKAGK